MRRIDELRVSLFVGYTHIGIWCGSGGQKNTYFIRCISNNHLRGCALVGSFGSGHTDTHPKTKHRHRARNKNLVMFMNSFWRWVNVWAPKDLTHTDVSNLLINPSNIITLSNFCFITMHQGEVAARYSNQICN